MSQLVSICRARSIRSLTAYLAIMGMAGFSPSKAIAEFVTVGLTFGGDSMAPTKGALTTHFVLPKFDPSLGSLTDVAYSFSLDITIRDVAVENAISNPDW
ncbi:MAG: choice-of-anchor E domain-containing protein [Planctomycetota bacterium]